MQPIANDWLVKYNIIKQNRIKYLNKKFSGKSKHERKQPWFMLTKGTCYNFEERNEEWGNSVNYYKVSSEIKIFENKNIIHKKINHVELMEGLSNHKLNKWIKHNPKPCTEDDLFASQYIPQWNKQKEEALEHFRNVVISIYDKLKIYGRYEIGKDQYTEKGNGYPIKIGEVKDKHKELINKRITDLSKNSKILAKAHVIVNKEKIKHNNLVAGLIQDYSGKLGVILSPTIKIAA